MTIWLTRLNGLVALAGVFFSALPAAAAEIKVLAYNAVNVRPASLPPRSARRPAIR